MVETQFSTITLDQLPLEILMRICSYLDSYFVCKVLCRVCKAFYNIVTVESYWRGRILIRWPKRYPAIHDEQSQFNWYKACVLRETQYDCWLRKEETIRRFSYDCDITATVDCIHLLQEGQILGVGSRDSCLSIADVSKMTMTTQNNMKNARLHTVPNAHKGWIWCLTSDSPDRLYSGSWDKCIKRWNLEAGCIEECCFSSQSAVVDITILNDLLVAASYAKRVYTCDLRTNHLDDHLLHKKAVLGVAIYGDEIISCSEDGTLVFFDRKSCSVSDTLHFDQYPMTMSLRDGELWVGDRSGMVHLVDARPGYRKIVDTYDVGHTQKITGIQHTLGCLFTCSTDGWLKIHEPSQHPAIISQTLTSGQLCGLHFQNNVLATAGPNTCVEIWKPREDSNVVITA